MKRFPFDAKIRNLNSPKNEEEFRNFEKHINTNFPLDLSPFVSNGLVEENSKKYFRLKDFSTKLAVALVYKHSSVSPDKVQLCAFHTAWFTILDDIYEHMNPEFSFGRSSNN